MLVMAYDLCQDLVVMMIVFGMLLWGHWTTPVGPCHERKRQHSCAAPVIMAMALAGATQERCTCGCRMSLMHVQGAAQRQLSTQLGNLSIAAPSFLPPSYMRLRYVELRHSYRLELGLADFVTSSVATFSFEHMF